MAEPQFDVFLCHNSEDKPAVIEIAQQLQRKGLKPWLDVWELRPGVDWQEVLEEQIRQIKCVAVFVGKAGLGPWQKREMQAFIRNSIKNGSLVIPVLLPSAPQTPDLPIFLEGCQWVDFRLRPPDPLVQLVWGITGDKTGSRDAALNGESVAYHPTSLAVEYSSDEDESLNHRTEIDHEYFSGFWGRLLKLKRKNWAIQIAAGIGMTVVTVYAIELVRRFSNSISAFLEQLLQQ